jgi:catechol 2,3-dioxygenase-like lactoylglutathione lyase family enzyme
MITGMHAIIYSRDAAADRAFFRDVLGFPSVDAGGPLSGPPGALARPRAVAARGPARRAR